MAPPNVVFVLADQLRASALGCYGDRQVSTPNIDALAADGLRCENAYAPHPMCTPARASIQTGTLKFDHGAIRNWAPLDIPPEQATLGRSFRDRGYRTGYVGKWHLDGQTGRGTTFGSDDGDGSGFVPPGHRRRGYDFWRGFNDGHNHHDGHPQFTREGEVYRERPGEWQPTVQTDIASEFVARNAAEPFFLFLSWGPPHPPFVAPEGYGERFDPEELDLPPNVPGEIQAEVRENLAEYYGMIEALDDDLGDLLDAIDVAGVAEETIVVFTADHGEMMGAHGHTFGKGYPHEPSANVPLVVRYPGAIEAGRTSSGLLSLVDLYPTLAGLCDVSVPSRVTGRDRSAHFRGEAPEPDEPIYMSEGWRAIRTGPYMLRVESGLEPVELYDVEADPHQQENLVEEADPELLGALVSRLIESAYRVNDYEMTGESFRRGAPWGDDLDAPFVDHLDVDYERYGEWR